MKPKDPEKMENLQKAFQPFISYWLFPLLLIATGVICYIGLEAEWAPAAIFSWFAGIRLAILFGVEFAFPAKKEWKMTWRTFWRDLKYWAATFAIFRVGSYLIGLFALSLAAENSGFMAEAPLLVGVVATALVWEFFQYWFHRWSHEGPGWLGDWLWRVHVTHHLPDRVYLVMHAVRHPIGAVIAFFIASGSVLLVGASQEAVLVFLMFRSLISWISHFNVDIKAGPLNYIFAGTEPHRLHHSADPAEGKNYGAFLLVWDLVFGTFVNTHGKLPKRLGVQDESAYPESYEVLKVLSLPFSKKQMGSQVEPAEERA